MARNGHSLRLSAADLAKRAERLSLFFDPSSSSADSTAKRETAEGDASKPARTPRKPKAPIASEHAEQSAVISWWALNCTRYGIPLNCLFAIPNGANKSMASAVKFKREGLRAGCPDLFLAVPKHGTQNDICNGVMVTWPVILFHGLFIEAKRIGGKASPAQLEFATMLRKQGYSVVIAQGFEEMKRAIVGYLES